MATVADILRQTQFGGTRTSERLMEYMSARALPRQVDDELRGPLQYIIDIASAPLYGVASVADAQLRGDGDLASAAWRGLTLQERKTFVDILQARGVPAAPVVGLVLDIGLDPLTYLGGAPYKLAKTAFMAARRTKQFDRFVDTMRSLSFVDTFGRLFSTTWKYPAEYVEMRNAFRRAYTDRQREIWDEVMKFVREIPVEERRLMMEVRTKPWLLNQLSPKAQKRYLEIARELDDLALKGWREGLWTLDTVIKYLGEYVPIRYQERLPPLNIRIGGRVTRPSFVRPREFESLEQAREFALDVGKLAQVDTLQAARQLAQQLDKKWKGTFFTENVLARQSLDELRDWARYTANIHTPIDDIAKAIFIYRNEWNQYYAQSRFLRGVLKRFGKLVTPHVTPAADEGIFEVPEWLRRAVPEGSRWILPKEIARELNDLSQIFVTGGEATKLFRWFDKLTGNWKTFATVWRLPFHLRNLYSNYFMMYLAGVPVERMPNLSEEALKVLYAESDTAQKLLRFKPTDRIPGLNTTYKGLQEDLRRIGVIHTGFLSSELYNIGDVYAFIKGDSAKWGRWELAKRMLDAPNKLGRVVENMARVALHIDGLQQGMDTVQASRRVFKFLFDYEDITPFERNVLRRVIPFYTWMRKNIPLQIHMMLQAPDKYLKPARAIHAWNVAWGLTEDEWEALPDWMRDLLWVKTPLKDSKGNPIYAYIDMPMQDVARLIETVQSPEVLAQQLHPIFDIMLTAMNVDVFPRARQLERFPGEMEPAPAWIVLLPEAMQEALGVEPMLDKKTRMMVLGLPKQRANVLRAIIPSGTLDFLAHLFGDTRAIVAREDEPWVTASYLTGIRFRPVDYNEERRWRLLEKKQRLAWAVALMRQRRRRLTPEELDELLR